MILYHATDMKNLDSILDKGILRGVDSLVFLAETPEDALKFVAIRLIRSILVCEVYVEDSLVEETFEHSERFFKCKAYGYSGDIPVEDINGYTRYEL